MAAISPGIRNERRTGLVDRRRTSDRVFATALPLEGIRVSWAGIWGGVKDFLEWKNKPKEPAP